MGTRSACSIFGPVLGLNLAFASAALGQAMPPQASSDAGPSVAEDESEGSSGPRLLTPEDYGQFESLGFGAVLSHDGTWMAYPISRVDGTSEMRVRMLATSETRAFPESSRPAFSADGKWLAYSIGYSPDERERMQKQNKNPQNKLGLLHLGSGETTEIEGVSSFRFDDSGAYLAMQRYGANGQRGSDVVIRDMATELDATFGNVTNWSWADDSTLLALIVRTSGGPGSGVQLYDAAIGQLRILDSSDRQYRSMTWRDDSADLAVLRDIESDDDTDDSGAATAPAARGPRRGPGGPGRRGGGGGGGGATGETNHDILVWWDLDTKRPADAAYEPNDAESFPAGHVITGGGLRWSDDGAAVFVQVRTTDEEETEEKEAKEEPAEEAEAETKPDDTEGDREVERDGGDERPRGRRGRRGGPRGPRGGEPAADTEEKPAEAPAPKPKPEEKPGQSLRDTLTDPSNVEVWHARDIDIVPRQKRTANRDRNRTKLAVWWIDEDAFIEIENDLTEEAMLLEGHRRAIGMDNTPHEEEKRFGPTLADLYVIDLETGEREQFLDANKFRFIGDPNGRYVMYARANDIWVYDIERDTHRNLTEGVDADFINDEGNQLTDEHRPYGIAGWEANGDAVWMHSRWDIWRFDLTNGESRRLTKGAGKRIRNRRYVIDPEAEEFIDRGSDVYVSLYGDRNKKSGYGRLNGKRRRFERLAWHDAFVSSLRRAEDADVYCYSSSRFDDSPDYFVCNADLEDARQVTETNPFMSDFLWGHGELVDYESDHGDTLQAALLYPAGYEPGKQYPMIVDIYENRSQGLHRFSRPSERSAYNAAVFTQQGYFVLLPDIVYRPQNPGLSAVECVVPAVHAALDKASIDPARVGLIGHSWGAYQTAFIVTQSDVFAAGIAGAPLTNMMSMSMSIYWNSGQTDAWIFHESQGRMDRPFWQDVDTYIANSPIFSIDDMNTPLMIAFGDDDGAVDFNQGVEMYNAARLAGKQFVMLVYPGENHGLARKENQVDYHYRILEWFGHYLKGEEAKPWITDGVPWLDQEEQRKK